MTGRRPDETSPMAEAPAIEFVSPGRFEVRNPSPGSPVPHAPIPAGATHSQPITGPDQLRLHTLEIARRARRSLLIYTPDLEPWLYDDATFVQACLEFVRAHPRNQLQVLLADPTRAIREGHRLVGLARRLTSKIALRRRNPEIDCGDCAFLIADDMSLIMRPNADQAAGLVSHQARGRVRQQRALFTQAWERGMIDSNLRSLYL